MESHERPRTTLASTILYSCLSLAGLILALPSWAAGSIAGTYDVGTLTPLERPPAFGDNLFLTQEAADGMAARIKSFIDNDAKKADPNRGAPEKGGR